MHEFEILMSRKIEVIEGKKIEQLKIPDKAVTATKFKLIITVVTTNLQVKDFPYCDEMHYSFYISS